jgi:hypothetical protein
MIGKNEQARSVEEHFCKTGAMHVCNYLKKMYVPANEERHVHDAIRQS